MVNQRPVRPRRHPTRPTTEQEFTMSTKTLAPILAVLFLIGAAALGQNTNATITGRVVDPTGAVVPNAEVRATNIATATTVSARTNDSGIYQIAFLTPGMYDVSVEMPGFK